MLRRMFLVLAILAMLTAIVLPHHSAEASPDMQTITLNTGFDHDAIPQGKYNVPGTDFFWSVIQDPVGGTNPEPRAADVIKPHPAWGPTQGTSQWISYSSNGSVGLVAGAYYYQKCFCMTKALWDNREAIQKSSLDVSVRADDFFYLGLNTIPDKNNPSSYILATTVAGGVFGGYAGNPAKLNLKGEELLKLLRPGRNCLTVRVDDIGGAITGFNLDGSLTATGIDGVAKAATPKSPAQFGRCSSCQNTKPDIVPGVRDVPIKRAN